MGIIKRKKIVDPNARVDIFSQLFSSVFFIGHMPVASGTFGSLAGVLCFFIPGFDSYLVVGSAIVACYVLGIITSQNMIKRYGHDPSVVVIDEVVGMWITMLFVMPAIGMVDLEFKSIILAIGFISFRFFDITKVWPSKIYDRIDNGYGIMMDDVIAGIYAGVVTFLATGFLIANALSIGLGLK